MRTARAGVFCLVFAIGCARFVPASPSDLSVPSNPLDAATMPGSPDLAVAATDAAFAIDCPAPARLGSGHGEAFSYGRHHPNGSAAVAYLYSADGMWKNMNPLEYTSNYYPQYATANHPYDKAGLIAYANGTHFTTARDANRHLLADFNHDGELDAAMNGFAFHEHNGKGAGGATRGTPFTNFWFDDNWLARYVSQAYAQPLPNGLSEYGEFVRWRILGGDRSHWTPYN